MTTFSTIIVGTGFSGLGMAIALKKAGRTDFVVLEKADEVGGTWRDNHYPGCACDIPAHLYSFSFQPNPDWSRTYAPQEEILAYLKRCAEKYGIRPHIRFGAEVRRAVFDEEEGRWTVETAAGAVLRARYLVFGVGGLSRPAHPDLPGLERFRGSAFHSAEWDHGCALAGKRVAVIGTGASAIQFVPQIAGEVGRLHLFQRTAPWVLPRPNRAVSARVRRLFRAAPPVQRLRRNWCYWTHELRGLGFTVAPRVLKLAGVLGRQHLRRQVKDPALRAALTPNYAPGCKRLLMANDYYPALCQDHVTVVTEEIASVTEDAIVTRSGERYPVDVIIYGTGFRVRDFLVPMEIRGRGGQDLNDAWQKDVQAYLGTTIAGFPNLYVLMGPNTGLGHNSMVFMIEAQIHYALRLMREVEAKNARFADLRKEVQTTYNEALQPRLRRAVWGSGCRSWYLDEKGHNATLWPGFTVEFWLRTRRVKEGQYAFV